MVRLNKIEISSKNKDELNETIRNKFIEIFNRPPTSRELEIEQILKEEKEKYELDKIAFESNPIDDCYDCIRGKQMTDEEYRRFLNSEQVNAESNVDEVIRRMEL